MHLVTNPITTPDQSPSPEVEQEDCVSFIHDSVHAQSGIVRVGLDPGQAVLSLAYDARQLSAADVEQLAGRMAPTFHRHFETCTLRLGRQGGRACEACSAVLENRLRHMEGVRRASASYVGGALSVTYDNTLIAPSQIAEHVRRLGVPLAPDMGEAAEAAAAPSSAAAGLWCRARAWLTLNRLEAICTATTFVAMMGGILAQRLGAAVPMAAAWYSVAYVAGGAFGIKGSLEALRQRTLDVDLLMVLAALGAWAVGSPFEGAMLLFLFSLSNVLQAYAIDRARHAIQALVKLRPKEALTRRGGRLARLPVEKLLIGDVVIVRPGERIPVDGQVVEGESSVDQSSITGESMPVSKAPGSGVLAGTINQSGGLELRVARLARDTTLAKMIKLVEEAHSEKAQTQRLVDRFEQVYAWCVIGLTVLLIMVPVYVLGQAFEPVFYRAMTVLVAASPCALVISTPASMLSAIGNGARRGVLFKGGIYVEQAAGVKVVAFDKTGTLTLGKPQVTDIVPLAGPGQVGEPELLALTAAVEAKSEHPLALAIVKAAQQRGLVPAEATAFQSESGKGARATVAGQEIAIGNLRYFEGLRAEGLGEARGALQRLLDQAKTSVLVARLLDESRAEFLGLIGVADVVRPEAAQVVRELKAMGVERVVMLTGDNERVAQSIARQVGVDEFYADLLPEDKLRIIGDLQRQVGPLAMVGDGVNDAPGLAQANIGIAMGAAGTDVALETADIVLMADDLRNIPYLMALSRQTRKTLLTNLGFAVFMIGLMLVGIFLVRLPLPLAVVGHEGGTVLVSLNGLRLLLYRYRH
jgi:Cd2+/Zn2+-exporting ATPase